MRLLSLLDDEKEDERQRDKIREMRLHEAAMKGTVTSLLELLDEDPLILTTTSKPSSSISDTPLHVAALLGHIDFAKELLSRKPELAGSLNSQGSTPLHVAAAKGYLEIVKELVMVNPDMCFVLDSDGRNPIDLAAIKGRVQVLNELIRVKPEAAQVLTGGGATCLHLCVKYNRLEALKVLMECIGKDEFVNWKDRDGNTVLHVAVAKKQIQIIKFLFTNTGIEVNARNANGFTALDVLSEGPRDLRDMEIKESLRCAGASRIINDAPSITYNREIAKVSPLAQPPATATQTKQLIRKHKHVDWLGRKRSALMVVASLIATVAFQAALSPPGGVWQDDFTVDSDGNPVDNAHNAGKSVMAYNRPDDYGYFMIFNTIAFLSSLSIILLLVSGLPLKRRRWMWIQMVIMWIAITAQTSTYFIALSEMTPSNVQGVLYYVYKISVMVWLGLMGLVFIGNVIRMIFWFLRKYGYIKEKQRGTSVYIENDENDDL